MGDCSVRMITPAFTKLQRSIVTSSIWLQDMETRLVWITLLALCDRDGVVRASPLGLAHQARVSNEGCQRALELLQAPDGDSRSLEHGGRRVERIEGGFLVLNYTRVLSEGMTQEKRDYDREKKSESRARQRANGGTVRPEHRDDKGRKKAPKIDKIVTNGFSEPAPSYLEERHKLGCDCQECIDLGVTPGEGI